MGYCENCGTQLVGGVCPKCTAATSNQQQYGANRTFDSYLMNPAEKIVCVLGNSYLQNFLSSGFFSQGFSVVSDKRVYFRGKVFETLGNKLHKTQTSKAVNVRDITGVSVTNILPIHLIITGAVLLLLGIILSFFSGWFSLLGFVCAAVCGLMFFFKRVTLLKIEYAGGAIGFDIKWFAEQESLDYQKALFLTKDKIFDTP